MHLVTLSTLIDTHHMIPDGCTVLVACSGGADSICLLHGLLSLQASRNFSLAVAHYNHQLRGAESARDEAFVRHFVTIHCPTVPIFVDTAPVADIAQKMGQGIEETARILRYAFFESIAQRLGNTKIATAHTADDNGETVLMHLVRGSGLRGLSGVPPVRDAIIRPLLSTTRREIEAYLSAHQIPHVEDSSNADKTYLRNRVRHDIMPILREINPNFLPRLEQTTALLREENDHLDAQVKQALCPSATGSQGFSLPISGLLSLPRPLALRGIQQLAMCCNPDIVLTLSHRLAVLQLCNSPSPSASVNLPCHLLAHRQYDLLVITKSAPTQEPEPLTLNLPCTAIFGGYQITISPDIYTDQMQTPLAFWLDASAVGDSICLRSRQTGDALQRANRPNASLKKQFIDAKIPLRVRDRLPVFVAGEQIAAVALLGASKDFLPKSNASAWHILMTCHTEGNPSLC